MQASFLYLQDRYKVIRNYVDIQLSCPDNEILHLHMIVSFRSLPRQKGTDVFLLRKKHPPSIV